MIEIAFWLAVATIVYAYFGFPALLALRARLCPRRHGEADITPTVSMVICAYNEADVIERKLDNLLSLDYPADRLEVIVASDGSDDGTDDLVRAYADRGVRLLPMARIGKIPALNAAVARTTGDILVFSDANSIYADDALRRLVAPFGDPEVGGVAGDQRYVRAGDGDDQVGADGVAGERVYWDFDRKWKVWQSLAGNVTSATGAIYAVRRVLFRDLPTGVTDDFANSTGVISQGHRLVFAADAAAYEHAVGTGDAEFRRKVRVMTRGFRGVWARRDLLDPRRHGFYAVQLFSHKIVRRLVVLPLLFLLPAAALLWDAGMLYRVALLAQLALYGAAALGAVAAGSRVGKLKPLAFPYYFCLVNLAALTAALNVVRGHSIDMWDPPRHGGEAGDGEAAAHAAAVPGARRA